ncbi:MAG: HPr family phosphocarrier protein [Oscillospiraceae bacterium]|nr:HPr family phosphocarrier protein [Oscillospiraceae bacterium]MBP1568383.1 HPr family phosphocarrier protein [Oscillospiraceae bacterium]MBP1591022.1 HPr family phosphocarrier protein [Oscillospiraceae bacterium]
MYSENVLLSGVAEVKKFVDVVSKYDFNIELVSGKYVVDAKSIMGIFSLDLEKPVHMNADTDDEGFKAAVAPFIASK